MTPEAQEIFIRTLNTIVCYAMVQGIGIGMFVGFAVQINVHFLSDLMTVLLKKLRARKVS